MLSLQAHPVPAPHSAHSGAPLVQGGVDNGPACAGPSMSVTSCLPASASSLPAHCGPAPPPPSPLACTTVHRSTARPPRLRHHSTSACCLLPPQVRWAGPRPASAGCPGPVCAAHKCGGTQGGRGGARCPVTRNVEPGTPAPSRCRRQTPPLGTPHHCAAAWWQQRTRPHGCGQAPAAAGGGGGGSGAAPRRRELPQRHAGYRQRRHQHRLCCRRRCAHGWGVARGARLARVGARRRGRVLKFELARGAPHRPILPTPPPPHPQAFFTPTKPPTHSTSQLAARCLALTPCRTCHTGRCRRARGPPPPPLRASAQPCLPACLPIHPRPHTHHTHSHPLPTTLLPLPPPHFRFTTAPPARACRATTCPWGLRKGTPSAPTTPPCQAPTAR